MSDCFSKEKRSELMSNIGVHDTEIELMLRKALWKEGIRYRVNVKDVAGKPDICHKGKKIAIFVDGCFWHGCPECDKDPDSNSVFWRKKIEDNKRRREEVKRELQSKGWTVLEFWGHEIKNDLDNVVKKVTEFF